MVAYTYQVVHLHIGVIWYQEGFVTMGAQRAYSSYLACFQQATDALTHCFLPQVAVTQDDDEMTGFCPEAKVCATQLAIQSFCASVQRQYQKVLVNRLCQTGISWMPNPFAMIVINV